MCSSISLHEQKTYIGPCSNLYVSPLSKARGGGRKKLDGLELDLSSWLISALSVGALASIVAVLWHSTLG